MSWELYHNKKHQGTTTWSCVFLWQGWIIPQQETSGNYNEQQAAISSFFIIPQQETSGNYNKETRMFDWHNIIPQQETSGIHILIHRLNFFAILTKHIIKDDEKA